jgi:adenine-specific DNA-methyltransferase
MQFQNNNSVDNYAFDYRKLEAKTETTDVELLFNKKENENITIFEPIITKEKYKDGTRYLKFWREDQQQIFEQILDTDKIAYLEEDEIAQGIVFPQDFLNKTNQKKLCNNFVEGQGVFGLSNAEKMALSLSEDEKQIIKPYFSTEQIQRYYSSRKNNLWMIYTDSSFNAKNIEKNPTKMDKFPNIKQHLDRFLDIFTSDNKPYGLHRAREEKFFKGKKIVVQRKCSNEPVFSYNDFDCYVTQTFFIIQTNRFNLKYLTGLLNSKLIAYWLKYNGKMQGDNYQLDKEPLMQIPIYQPTENQSKQIADIVDKILAKKAIDIDAEQQQIDILTYKMYDLTLQKVNSVKELGNNEITDEIWSKYNLE